MPSVTDRTYGLIRYSYPDASVPASERSLYSFPASITTGEYLHELHDIRTSSDIVKGGAGLDVQGFTYVEHESKLSGVAWFAPGQVEDVYVPEVCELICKITGAKSAVVDGMAFRRKPPAATAADPSHVEMRGSELDQMLSKLRRDTMRVPGRDMSSTAGPAGTAHIDYNVQGLRDTARYAREDVKKAAQATIDAEDAGKSPRYGVYSIWRPLETVKRDPLAVLDHRTLDPSELIASGSRAFSGIRSDGEYIRWSGVLAPPKYPESQKWYYVSEQQPNEVLIIKFADTAAEQEGCGIAATGVHCAAAIPGTENEKTRQSIECRILAFW